ncbi:hypothetical protein CEXT_428681 [Caerostris extrusa]|uniref:Uncharacterized protein n=1 Tax=Caerostris extrusa TaxID=172846 RepID=A0AAV4MYJ4_CAEEX|nr:hypothetical protein CEXT_428681 [Caerostris extrusa]
MAYATPVCRSFPLVCRGRRRKKHSGAKRVGCQQSVSNGGKFNFRRLFGSLCSRPAMGNNNNNGNAAVGGKAVDEDRGIRIPV